MPVLNIKAAVQAMACSKSNVDQKMVPKQKKITWRQEIGSEFRTVFRVIFV